MLTGVPARVRTHDVTKQVEYIGDVQNLVEKLSDLPAGGQVLMGPLTYQRIYSRLEEFRIHSLQKSYEQPARSACSVLFHTQHGVELSAGNGFSWQQTFWSMVTGS